MSSLGDMLRDLNAYRGACGDLCAGALRLTPQELADLTLQVAGQSPQRAREIVAQFLSKTPAAEEILPPGSFPKRNQGRSHQLHRSRLQMMCRICRQPRSWRQNRRLQNSRAIRPGGISCRAGNVTRSVGPRRWTFVFAANRSSRSNREQLSLRHVRTRPLGGAS